MNTATWKCSREYLGLTHAWIADQLGKNEKYVSSWDEPRRKSVPDYAAAFMREQLDVAAQLVGAMTVKWHEQKGDSPIAVPAGAGMAGGMPASYHRRIASRVAERINVDIDYII